MSCSNHIPNIDFGKCSEEIKNPFGEDILNHFLESSSNDGKGTITLVYRIPIDFKFEIINPKIEIRKEFSYDEGVYLLTAIFRS